MTLNAPAGTGESLVGAMAKLAAAEGAESLSTLYKYREYGRQWLDLGFVPTRPGLLKSPEGDRSSNVVCHVM